MIEGRPLSLVLRALVAGARAAKVDPSFVLSAYCLARFCGARSGAAVAALLAESVATGKRRLAALRSALSLSGLRPEENPLPVPSGGGLTVEPRGGLKDEPGGSILRPNGSGAEPRASSGGGTGKSGDGGGGAGDGGPERLPREAAEAAGRFLKGAGVDPGGRKGRFAMYRLVKEWAKAGAYVRRPGGWAVGVVRDLLAAGDLRPSCGGCGGDLHPSGVCPDPRCERFACESGENRGKLGVAESSGTL
jgi:hypothetical protein